MNRIKRFLKSIYKILQKPELAILPGQIAFSLILSIIPIITLLAFLASSLSVSLELMTNFLGNNLPKQIINILTPFLNGKGFGTNTFLYTLLGFYLASNGPKAMIVASNTLYDIKGYNIIVRRIKSLFITIILLLLFIFLIFVLGFGNTIVDYLMNLEELSTISKDIYMIYVMLKWPISFFVIFISIKLIYTLSPDRRLKSKYVNKGALFTTIMWMVVSMVYSYYVTNIADYTIMYGNLASIIILMVWIYVLSVILVIGIAINTSSYESENNN